MSPSPTAATGRSESGRFTVGNSFAKGNPHASKVQKLRAAMLEAVTEEQVDRLIKTLIVLGEAGDLKAIKLLFDVIGRPEGNTPPVSGLGITEDNFEKVKNELLSRAN